MSYSGQIYWDGNYAQLTGPVIEWAHKNTSGQKISDYSTQNKFISDIETLLGTSSSYVQWGPNFRGNYDMTTYSITFIKL